MSWIPQYVGNSPLRFSSMSTWLHHIVSAELSATHSGCQPPVSPQWCSTGFRSSDGGGHCSRVGWGIVRWWLVCIKGPKVCQGNFQPCYYTASTRQVGSMGSGCWCQFLTRPSVRFSRNLHSPDWPGCTGPVFSCPLQPHSFGPGWQDWNPTWSFIAVVASSPLLPSHQHTDSVHWTAARWCFFCLSAVENSGDCCVWKSL